MAQLAMSVLKFRAQPQGFAGGTAHPPLGPLCTPRSSGARHEPPRKALLLGLRQHLAAPFTGELTANIRVHLIHLFPCLWLAWPGSAVLVAAEADAAAGSLRQLWS